MKSNLIPKKRSTRADWRLERQNEEREHKERERWRKLEPQSVGSIKLDCAELEDVLVILALAAHSQLPDIVVLC